MCRIYNKVGSLSTIKSLLEKNNIHEFESLKGLIDFQSSYPIYRQQLISHHENLIEQEKNMLQLDLQQLETSIEAQRQQSEQKLTAEIDKLKEQLDISINGGPANFFQKKIRDLKHWNYKRQIKIKEQNFDIEIIKSISKLVEVHNDKQNRYQFITSQFSDAVKESSQQTLLELERKKTVIDELNNFIYGALGERKVVKTLEALSDEYYLINDFAVSFSPALYSMQNNDYIKTVQIDHLLIAPSGIFLIETKNWSAKSLENLSLRSPVEQIKRASFVLFKLLNHEMSAYQIGLDKHHWGDKKISIRNLIVLTNAKPKEEFQYVKILTLSELLSYINYFKPTLTNIETKRITEALLELNDQKIISTK